MEPFLGEVRLMPYSFAPRGWMLCDGQLLPVSAHTALFSIIGTTYGGDGRSTFALPDLKARAATGAGQGPGLQDWEPGTRRGEDAVALTLREIPRHNHDIRGLDTVGDANAPSASAYLGQDRRRGGQNLRFLAPSGTAPDTRLAITALATSGESQPHENRQPFLSVNYCIAVEGLFPRRP